MPSFIGLPSGLAPTGNDPERKFLKGIGEQTASQSTCPEDSALSGIFQSSEVHHSEEAEYTPLKYTPLSKMGSVHSLWEGMYWKRELWIPLSEAHKGGLRIRKTGHRPFGVEPAFAQKVIFSIRVYVYLHGL